MSNKKTIPTISSSEASKMSVSALAVRPNDASRFGQGGLSTKALQEWFDKLPNLVKDKFNEIAQMLASTDAAKYITLGGEDNALGETLFDFLALFGPRGDGITDKNISDLIETLYQGEGDEGASSRTLKDIVASICARLVDLRNFAGRAVGDFSLWVDEEGRMIVDAIDLTGDAFKLNAIDPIGKAGIRDGAVGFEKLDSELGGRVSRAFAKARYTASDGKLHFDSADGVELDSIDLPLESIIVSGTFDTSTKDLVFTLVGGGTLRIPFDAYIEAVASDVARLNAKTDKSFKTATLAGDDTLVLETHDGSASTVDLSTVALDGQTRDTIARLEKKDVDHERRISNLEEHISDDYFVTDSDVAYKKSVPARACSSAKLLSLGGMTYRDEETNTLRDSKVTEIKSHGANLADIYGFSAVGIYTPSTERYLSNNYGTTISTVDAGNSITVNQSQYPNAQSPTYYDNGFFCIGINQDFVGGEAFTFSCDVKIHNNLGSGYQTSVMPNGASNIYADVVDGRLVAQGTWKDSGEKKFIEIRLAGISATFSNFMLERGHTDGTYKPMREPISYPIPAEIQAIEGYGKDGFNIDLVAQMSDYNDTKKPLPVFLDSIIKVEGGGLLEFVNEYKNPVPSAVKYLLKEESAV